MKDGLRKENRMAATSPRAARPGGNFGRGLLASSHAGTRLPIAANAFRPERRALPLRPLPNPGTPADSLPPPSWRFFTKSKTARKYAHRRQKSLYRLPTAALPASGERVEASASSQPSGSPAFLATGYHCREDLSSVIFSTAKTVWWSKQTENGGAIKRRWFRR